jgi:hyperosmotically inducible protein
MTDAWLTTKAKSTLLTSHGLSPLSIHVDTSDRVVTLFGIVASDAIKQECEETVMGLEGVRHVNNELQVVPESEIEQARTEDRRVLESVESKLWSTDEIQSRDISVAVENGVVRLTGSVLDPEDRLVARSIARTAEGVRSVIDDLRVERPS